MGAAELAEHAGRKRAGSNADQETRKKPRMYDWQKDIEPGTVLVGRVDRHEGLEGPAQPSLRLRVQARQYVRIAPTEVLDVEDWKSNPFKTFYPGQFVKCVVLRSVENSRIGGSLDVSARPSLLNQVDETKNRLPEKVLDNELKLASEYPSEGELVKGFVDSVNKVGAFIRIKRGVLAIVPLKHLADRFIKDTSKEFPVGKLVAGRVITSDESKRKLVLSLRATSVLGRDTDRLSFEDIKEGVAYRGTVASVVDFGIFVNLENSNRVGGLVHKSELTDGKQPVSHDKLYSRGDKVKIVVINVDADKKRLGFSLKPSLLATAKSAEGQDDDDDEEEEEKDEGIDEESSSADEESSDADSDADSDVDSDAEGGKAIRIGEDADDVLRRLEADSSDEEDNEVLGDNDDDEDEENEDEDEDEEDDDVDDDEEEEGGTLSLADAIQQTEAGAKEWSVAAVKARKNGTGAAEDEDDEDSDSDSEAGSDDDSDAEADATQKKERRKAKRAEAKRQARERALDEAKLAALEQAKLEEEGVPQSVDDFERLLMGSPNSSMLWIQYMAFQTAQVEVDQARGVAERAMRTINYRMETEKQNVLLALLRIECKHGSSQTVEKCCRQILERMDKDAAYLEIAKVFEENNQMDKADDALRKAVKAAHGASEIPWLRRIELKFKAEDPAGAQELLVHAQRNVDKQVRPKLYLGYARLEYSMAEAGGKSERARTILEALIDENPKRNDLWLQYIDMEIKYGNEPSRVTNLFERAVAAKFSIKKTKTFFKRWLLYESDHGTEEGADRVKAKARDYVASVTDQD